MNRTMRLAGIMSILSGRGFKKSPSLDAALTTRKEIRELQVKIYDLHAILLSQEDNIEREIVENWSPREIAFALETGNGVEAARHLNAAIKGQKSWHSVFSGQTFVDRLLKASVEREKIKKKTT